jgi:hypothetical protein
MTRTEPSTTRRNIPVGATKKSRKPDLCSPHKSLGKTIHQSKGKALYCLLSNGQYIRDHSGVLVDGNSSLLTENPRNSLRFIDQDIAIARAKALATNGLKVEIKLILFPYG